MASKVRVIPVAPPQRYPFVVDERPYCVWDPDIAGCDLEFLQIIDPAYFDHLALSMGKLLDGEEANYAAVTLRTAYSHALETLFALIGATVQSPQSIAGWILSYGPTELENLIAKIHHGEPVKTKLALDPLTWETLAIALTPIDTGNAEKDQNIRQHFGEVWRRLAHDFLAKETSDEYNSIKHGLRVSMHGFYLAFGMEETPGVPAPSENMVLMSDSKFGNSYYVTEKLHDSRNFRILRKSHNWNPWKFVYALQLISMSINNIVSTLKVQLGVSGSEALCKFPNDVALFKVPWEQEQPGMTTFNWNPILTETMVVPMTKKDILASYNKEG